ncbi:MAG: pyridoxal phosphate-dependent aminotransferase, partial [Myxococcota bacterium]|nr:pyridoxal phosphate-dependent aminotransferase [Myxococcota bacterium]
THLAQHPEDHGSLLILNYPANPDGCSYDAGELEALAVVAKQYALTVLSDEIYSMLVYNSTPLSIAQWYPEGTIVSTGLSKWCGAGGWRLGCFAFPPDLFALRDALAVTASETFSSVSAPIQYAAVEAFAYGEDVENYVRHTQRLLAALARNIVGRLREHGVQVCTPDGAYYLFVDFAQFKASLAQRGIHTSQELCGRLLQETGVAILAGSHFYRPAEELTARLAFVDFAGDEVLKASVALGLDAQLDSEFIEKHFAKVLAGIEFIGRWLSP